MARSIVAPPARLAERLVQVTREVRGRIPTVHTDWVSFDPAEHAELRKHLDTQGVDELSGACNVAGALYHGRQVNPISVSAIRNHLLKVAEAAGQLQSCFDMNSRHAMTLVSLLEFECDSGRGMHNTKELVRLLSALAAGCRKQAKGYVGQARRHAPEYQVRCIARVLEPRGIKASAAPGSRFTRLVRICFSAMGIHSDPGRAIRSYIDHKDDESFSM